MRAFAVHAQAPIDTAPLVREERAVPSPGPGEILVEVRACGVCRTDLHVVEGDLPLVVTPIVPGHQVVGGVVRDGARFRAGGSASTASARRRA